MLNSLSAESAVLPVSTYLFMVIPAVMKGAITHLLNTRNAVGCTNTRLTPGVKTMPTQSNDVRISVLVMGFKRREFIRQALESVIAQSLPKEHYETICVLGFRDEALSAFMQINFIRELYCDGSLGNRLALGLRECRGEIVCFLDDDDMFEMHKLQRVAETFNNFPNIIYYHNNVSLIDGSSNPILQYISPYSFQINKSFLWVPLKGWSGVLNHRGDFNMSSICIRRSRAIELLSLLDAVEASPDSIIFFMLMEMNGTFYFDKEALTLYRIHESETNMLKPSTQDDGRGRQTAVKFYRSRLKAYQQLRTPAVRRIFLGYVLDSKFGAYIAGEDSLKPTFLEALIFFGISLARPSPFYFRLLTGAIVYRFRPGFVRKLQNKRTSKRYEKLQ